MNLMIEVENVYRQLQQRLDDLPVGFPSTKTGVEINLLKILFTPEEAKIAIKLNFMPEPLKKIHRRVKKMGISITELEKILERMVEKGTIIGGDIFDSEREEMTYSNSLYAPGIFDFQLKKLTKELVENHHKYIDEVLSRELVDKNIPSILRTIPVETSLTPEHHVGNYDNVKKLIENSDGPFAVMDCICRKSEVIMGKPCKNTTLLETCITLEEGAINTL
ncbi:MAG: hypothetical protein KAX33_04295, partial [Candidatus Lokiarchaeota archaeon]|nr:hypothetical protein [Candidatus Lokiarchaeota archaeon]